MPIRSCHMPATWKPRRARLHQSGHAGRAQQHLLDFLAELIHEGSAVGGFRSDVAPDELAASASTPSGPPHGWHHLMLCPDWSKSHWTRWLSPPNRETLIMGRR